MSSSKAIFDSVSRAAVLTPTPPEGAIGRPRVQQPAAGRHRGQYPRRCGTPAGPSSGSLIGQRKRGDSARYYRSDPVRQGSNSVALWWPRPERSSVRGSCLAGIEGPRSRSAPPAMCRQSGLVPCRSIVPTMARSLGRRDRARPLRAARSCSCGRRESYEITQAKGVAARNGSVGFQPGLTLTQDVLSTSRRPSSTSATIRAPVGPR